MTRPTFTPSGRGTLSVLEGGTKYPFHKLITAGHTPGTSTTTDEEYLDEDPTSEVAAPPAGEFTATYRPHPGRLADEKAEQAHADTSLITLVRDRGNAKTLQTGASGVNELAISNAGALTGSGSAATDFTDGVWQVGLGLVIANVLYIVTSITSATTATVARYGAVASKKATRDAMVLASVSATDGWSLVSLAVEETFTGRLTAAGGSETDTGGAVSASLTQTLTSRPSVKLVTP